MPPSGTVQRDALQHEDHVVVDHLDVVDGQERARRAGRHLLDARGRFGHYFSFEQSRWV